MNLQENGDSFNNQERSVPKATLNPNAAAFVPLSLRSPAGGISNADSSPNLAAITTSTAVKSMPGRSESSASINSNEEAHQYWNHQLPDDITPDFKLLGIDDNQGSNNEGLRYSASSGIGHLLNKAHNLPHLVNANNLMEKRYPVSTYIDHPSPTGFQHRLAKPWDRQAPRSDHHLAREGPPFNGNARNSFLASMPNEQSLMSRPEAAQIKFVGSKFPGFSIKFIEDAYFANGGNVQRTIAVLAKLEVDEALNRPLNSKDVLAPIPAGLHSPVFSAAHTQSSIAKIIGAESRHNVSPYGPFLEKETTRMHSSITPLGPLDYALPVKMTTQDSIWKYDRNGSPDTGIGFPRSSQNLASSHDNGQHRSIYGDRLENRGSALESLAWPGTREAMANVYPEMQEESRDTAHIRQTYLEQAKALTKEYNLRTLQSMQQMKAAQRNSDMQLNERKHFIDLQGLYVTEAMHEVKCKLEMYRATAGSAREGIKHSLLVYIFTGTGHGMRDPFSPRTRLALQQYLVEEGLDFTVLEPGLIQVVIY